MTKPIRRDELARRVGDLARSARQIADHAPESYFDSFAEHLLATALHLPPADSQSTRVVCCTIESEVESEVPVDGPEDTPPEVLLPVDGLAEGDWVRIRTRQGTTVARAAIVSGLAPGAVFGHHGWGADGPDGSPYDSRNPLAANLNRVISTAAADPVSGSLKTAKSGPAASWKLNRPATRRA